MKALAGRGGRPLFVAYFSRRNSPACDFHEKALLPSEGGGWVRPEEVIKGLGNPQDDSCSTLPHLHPSTVNLVVALMGSNPCEVLSSLCPGTGADGLFALVGRTSEVIDGRDRFRCSLEVAWDKKAEGISVRRFVMEEDAKCPR